MMINRVCVFCASSERVDRSFLDEAFKLGKLLGINGIELIYGGGKRGLMGRLSDGALSVNGKVIGVIPDFMNSLELGRKDINELREVQSMHDREAMLINQSDAILALPGGIGTFEELTQAIAWKYLGIIIKPIIIVNFNGYFEHILKAFTQAIDLGFMTPEHASLWDVVSNAEEAVDLVNSINGIDFFKKPDIHLT